MPGVWGKADRLDSSPAAGYGNKIAWFLGIVIATPCGGVDVPRRFVRSSRNTGFPAVERRLAMIIAALLIGAAMPSFETLVQEAGIDGATRHLLYEIRSAHSLAISRGSVKQVKRFLFDRDAGGFTLIEVLMAVSTFLIVLFAVYTSFESSRETYGAGEQRADIQQSARMAIELMEADLRLAGYGFPRGAGNAITAATPTAITFTGDLLNVSTTITNIDVNPGDATLNVQDASGIRAGDSIYLINGGDWEQLTVQAVNTGVNPHIITTTTGVTDTYPWGTQVGRPLTVSYCWYDNPDADGIPAPALCAGLAANTLYRDEGIGAGLQPLADNMQTVQLQYFDANDVATANPADIRRITITLTTQSPPGWWRPQAFNIASDVRPRNL